MSFLAVYGHVVLDYILHVPRLPEPDTSIRVTGRSRHFGGTGGNLARAAARLGVETALASFVGEDFPEDYRRALEEEGVDLTDLRPVEGYLTPTAWIFTDAEDRQVAVIDQGPMDHTSAFPLAHHTAETSEWVHLGTGRPEYQTRVHGLARREGKSIAFDPSQEIHYLYEGDSFRGLLRGSDIFFGNASEVRRASEYLGVAGPEEILDHVGTLVETRGSEGSVIYSGDGVWRIPAIPPRVKTDVTGAGEAYRAGFYAGLRKGLGLPECGLLGAAVASFAIEAEGPQNGLPHETEAANRAARYEKEVVEA